jgi:RNA polymerase sigma factor (sigma-70 family)
MSEAFERYGTEQEALAAARRGDVAAFAALYQAHHTSALAYARTLTNPVRAHDLVAEATARVYRLVREGKGPETSFRAYLLAAIRTVNVDSLRRTGREILVDDVTTVADQAHPDSSASLAESDTVLRAFRSLPPRWQQVLWSIAVEGHSTQDMGIELNLSPNAVSVLSKRAREGLRQAYLTQHVHTAPAGRECEGFAHDLARYVRRALVPKRRIDVEAHLQECRGCKVAVSTLDDINNRLGASLLPAFLCTFPVTAGAGSTVAVGGSVAHSVLGSLKAKTAAVVVATVGSVVVAGSVAAGIVQLHRDSSGAREALGASNSSTALGDPAQMFEELRDLYGRGGHHPGMPTTPAGPLADDRDPSAPRPEPGRADRETEPTEGAPEPARSTPSSDPGAPMTPLAAPEPEPSLLFTQVGICTMEDARTVCTTDPGGPDWVLALTPSAGGSCSISAEVVMCTGPLTVTERQAPDPATGDPTVLYSQSGSSGYCEVSDHVLTCYAAPRPQRETPRSGRAREPAARASPRALRSV